MEEKLNPETVFFLAEVSICVAILVVAAAGEIRDRLVDWFHRRR